MRGGATFVEVGGVVDEDEVQDFEEDGGVLVVDLVEGEPFGVVDFSQERLELFGMVLDVSTHLNLNCNNS